MLVPMCCGYTPFEDQASHASESDAHEFARLGYTNPWVLHLWMEYSNPKPTPTERMVARPAVGGGWSTLLKPCYGDMEKDEWCPERICERINLCRLSAPTDATDLAQQ
jgi:hypothetical protein